MEGTTYGISPSGWMTTEVFSSWFDHFVAVVEERPLLLILDGHITHTSLSVIEKAINEDVTILKLPPHSTDLLQPLDVACFAPLKRLWMKKLNLWINQWGPRLPVRKHNLVNLLGEIWEQGLSPKNIMAGFSATGVYPVDKTKYPADRLDNRLLRRYNTWVAAGKPDDVKYDLATAISTPQKGTPRKETAQPLNVAVSSLVPPNYETSTPEVNERGKKCVDFATSKPKGQPPPGKMWAAVWALVDAPHTATPTQLETSFEELVLAKMKGPPPKPDQPATRRRCDLKSKVVTGDEYLHAIKEANDRGKKRKLPAAAKTAKPMKSIKKRFRFRTNSSSSSSSELSSNDLFSGDEEEHEVPSKASVTSKDEILTSDAPPSSSMVQSLITEIGNVTKSLDDDKVNCYYAVYYGSKYYWGKLLKCFSFDSDSDVEQVEMSFLRY